MTTWDKIKTWELVLPPSRPCGLHLNKIRNAISRIDRTLPVAVLGSTPEFRDLLHETGFSKIYVLDNKPSVYRQMSQLMAYNKTENFVEGDWFDTLRTKRDFFAVILSDLTSGNVKYEDREHFYDLISSSLMAQGIFIDKVLTHPDEKLLLISDLSKKYGSLPLNLLHINYFSCEVFFCSELLDLKGIVDTTLFYQKLEKELRNEKVSAFLSQAEKITPRDCIWYYGKRWSALMNSYCRKLRKIHEYEDEPGSPYFGRVKLFVNIKEKKV